VNWHISCVVLESFHDLPVVLSDYKDILLGILKGITYFCNSSSWFCLFSFLSYKTKGLKDNSMEDC
jgi:hypothetical protein